MLGDIDNDHIHTHASVARCKPSPECGSQWRAEQLGRPEERVICCPLVYRAESVTHRCRPQILETERLGFSVCGVGLIYEWFTEVGGSPVTLIWVGGGLTKKNIKNEVRGEVFIEVKKGITKGLRGGITKTGKVRVRTKRNGGTRDRVMSGCQSCSWSAEQRKLVSPCPRSRLRTWSRETVLAVPSHASLLVSILRPNLVLTYGVPPSFRVCVRMYSLDQYSLWYNARRPPRWFSW